MVTGWLKISVRGSISEQSSFLIKEMDSACPYYSCITSLSFACIAFLNTLNYSGCLPYRLNRCGAGTERLGPATLEFCTIRPQMHRNSKVFALNVTTKKVDSGAVRHPNDGKVVRSFADRLPGMNARLQLAASR